MKIRKVSAVAAVMVSVLAPAGISAQAEITANAGWLSQYYYRGIPQKLSSASAGLDVATDIFSAGTWAADVGDGAEVDLYAGVAYDVTDMVNLSLGGTGYFYTGEFDVTYLEANVGVGVGPISIEWSFGQHKYDPDAAKYSFLGITAEQNGLFATVGTFSENLDSFSDAFSDMFTFKMEDLPATAGIHGQYLEAGYGFTAGDLDWVISGIWNDSEFSGEVNADDEPTNELTFVLGVSKTFNLN